MKTDKDKFTEWYKEFSSRNYGYFNGQNVDKWFDRVKKAHKDIEKFLGTSKKKFTVKLERDNTKPVDLSLIQNHGTNIQNLIYNYFIDYGVNWSNLAYPQVTIPKYKNMSWGKHIQTWMTRKKIPPEVRQIVNNEVSKIANIHAKAKTTDDVYSVIISTEPEAFAKIGHYGPDNSCFATGRQNELHKFIIGQNEDTFVGVVVKGDSDVMDHALMRFWGIADPTYQKWHVCNIYPRNHKDQGNIYTSIRKAFEQIVGEDVKTENYKFRIKGVFFNKESPVTYYPKSIKLDDMPVEIVQLQDDHLAKYRKCIRCEKQAGTRELEQIDYHHYCESCAGADVQGTCEISGDKTMEGMVHAYYKGKSVQISRLTLAEQFVTCNDGEYRHYTDVVKIGNSYRAK